MIPHYDKDEFKENYTRWRGQLTRELKNTISGISITLTEACEDGSFLFHADTDHWMTNPGGVMHGGIICTLMDTAMGSIAGCVVGHMTPSVSMDVQFVRPVTLDQPVCIRVQAASIGGTLAYMSGTMWQASEDRPCVTANGTYFTKG